MPWYRRHFVPGGTYFFTVVTHARRPILTTELGRNHLREAILAAQEKLPFEIVACVLLPDHLHCVWQLPDGDWDYSRRWSLIKEGFTRRYLAGGGTEAPVSGSRTARRERGVWQRRFWEHTIRDEDDLVGCVNYIHWNPVKHGHAQQVRDYLWSSFHRFVNAGEYDPDWGGERELGIPDLECECDDVRSEPQFNGSA